MHRIIYIAGIFCCNHIGHDAILFYRGNYLDHFGGDGSFRIFDLFYAMIAFVCDISKIMLKADYAIVSSSISGFLNAILLCNFSCLFLALKEDISKVIRRMAFLVGEWASLCTAQHFLKISVSQLYIASVSFALGKCHQVLVKHPLIANNEDRIRSGGENHLQIPWISIVASSLARSVGSISESDMPF